MAITKNIKCIAVTDHHTVDNVDIMKTLAKDTNVTVISGVEFRTEYGRASVHMIGLFPDSFNGINLTFVSEICPIRTWLLPGGGTEFYDDSAKEDIKNVKKKKDFRTYFGQIAG